MDKKDMIKPLYRILLLYEDVESGKFETTVDEYKAYLSKIGVRYIGAGYKDIYDMIKGLIYLGMNIKHDDVRSIVFDMIDIIKKGEQNGV